MNLLPRQKLAFLLVASLGPLVAACRDTAAPGNVRRFVLMNVPAVLSKDVVTTIEILGGEIALLGSSRYWSRDSVRITRGAVVKDTVSSGGGRYVDKNAELHLTSDNGHRFVLTVRGDTLEELTSFGRLLKYVRAGPR
jgi:hypothetical protein